MKPAIYIQKSFLMILCFSLTIMSSQLFAQKTIRTTELNKKSIASLNHVFKKYAAININTADIAGYARSNKGKKLDFDLQLPGIPAMRLSLEANNILAGNYKLISGATSGKQILNRSEVITYKGTVSNAKNSSVYLTITATNFSGFIRANGKEYFIEPLRNFDKAAKPGSMVLYESKDVVPHTATPCGFTAAKEHLQQATAATNLANRATGTCRKVEMAVAADATMRAQYGDVNATEEYMLSILNNMIGIYANTQLGSGYLGFVINGIYISSETAADPLSPAYDGLEAGAMLKNLSDWGEAGNFGFDYDVCQLWTIKDIFYEYEPGAQVDIDGLAINIGTVCTPDKYCVIQDRSMGASYPLTYVASLSAHEVAHCLGAFHDFEFAPTIMGNIALLPTPNTFSSKSVTDISAYINSEKASCLSSCDMAPIASFTVQGATEVDGQLQACNGSSVSLINNSLLDITDIKWSFAGATPDTSSAENPIISFNSGGVKTIELTVSNDYGTSTMTKTVNVLGEEIPGSLVVPETPVCSNTRFPLTYNGSDPSAQLQWFDQQQKLWISPQVFLTENQTLQIQPTPELSFEEFRIITDGSPCPKTSNVVKVNYLQIPQPVITGGDFLCSGSTTTLTVKDADTSVKTYAAYAWSIGQETTASITVTPAISIFYPVTVTGTNGCNTTISKYVTVAPLSNFALQATATNLLCAGDNTTLSFTGTKTAPGCTNSRLPQWPDYIYSLRSSNGIYEEMAYNSYAAEYAKVDVEAGKYYSFKILNHVRQLATDLITISDEAGTNILATGNSVAIWKATFTGVIRYYSHLQNCAGENENRYKMIACSFNLSSFGSWVWQPGGQTTETITVSPTTNTVYSLAFTNEFGCTASSTIDINAGISSVQLNTTAVTCNSATFNWVSPLNPSQWELEYKSTANGSKWIKVPIADVQTRSVTVTGLKSNQNYQWHIRAKCSSAATTYSVSVSFKTLLRCLTSAALTKTDPAFENETISNDLNATVMPNPSNNSFKLLIKTSDNRNGLIRITVMDMLGRLIETKTVTAGQVTTIGDKYLGGTYLLHVAQGRKTKQLKLIKVTN